MIRAKISANNVWSIATAASAADSTHTAASLNTVYPVTLGEMIAVETAALLLTAKSASDKLPVAFVSFSREDSSINVDVIAGKWPPRPSVEDAKETIEAYRKLLDVFVFPRVNNAHEARIDETARGGNNQPLRDRGSNPF